MGKKYSYIVKSYDKVAHLKLSNEFKLGEEITFELNGEIHTFSDIYFQIKDKNVTILHAGTYTKKHVAMDVDLADIIKED